MIEIKWSGVGYSYPPVLSSKHASDADYVRVMLSWKWPFVSVRTRQQDEQNEWGRIVDAVPVPVSIWNVD